MSRVTSPSTGAIGASGATRVPTRARLRATLGRLLCNGVAVVFLGSAVLKLVDLRAFEHSLGSWTLIPELAVPVLTVAIPLVELVAAVAWLLGLLRREAIASLSGLLLAFTALYAGSAWIAEPPDCGCFGFLLRHQRWVDEAWLTIARNVTLLVGLVLGAVLHPDLRRGLGDL